MKISNYIQSIFPNISDVALCHSEYSRIRFYFDDFSNNHSELGEFILSIIKDIFGSDTIYTCTMLFSEKDYLSKDTLNGLKGRGLEHIVDSNEKRKIIQDGFNIFQFYNQSDIEDLKKLNKAIIEQDYSIDPILSLRGYYFDLKKEVGIHLYDDRGMDVISKDPICLKEIAEKWSKTISVKFEN